jgi:hypothetical protein
MSRFCLNSHSATSRPFLQTFGGGPERGQLDKGGLSKAPLAFEKSKEIDLL